MRSSPEMLAPDIVQNSTNAAEALRMLRYGTAEYQIAYLSEATQRAWSALAEGEPFPGLQTQDIWTAQRLRACGLGGVASIEETVRVGIDDVVFDGVKEREAIGYPFGLATASVLAMTLGLVECPWMLSGQQLERNHGWGEITGQTFAILARSAIEQTVTAPDSYKLRQYYTEAMMSGMSQAMELSRFADAAHWFRNAADVHLDQDRYDFRLSIDLANSLLYAIKSVEIALAVLRNLGRGETVGIRGIDMANNLSRLPGYPHICASKRLGDLPELATILTKVNLKDMDAVATGWCGDLFLGGSSSFQRSTGSFYHTSARLMASIYAEKQGIDGVNSDDLFDVMRAIFSLRESFITDAIFTASNPS